MKLIKRFLSGLAILVLVILAIISTSIFFWRSEIIQVIENDSVRMVLSTRLGDIEYAVLGEGPPVLIIHGSPGGYDQSLIGPRAAPNRYLPGMKIIAVSRPGFLGTPLDSGKTYQAQADLFAELLDQLGIKRVFVLASSAGGRAAIQFALRYPERTTGLILRSTRLVQREDYQEEITPSDLDFLFEDVLMWIGQFVPSTWAENYDSQDPVQREMVKMVVASTVPNSQRYSGNLNDRIQYSASKIEDWPIGELTTPTLIVHGDADPMVSYSNAILAHELIPNSSLFTIEGGDHFLFVTHLNEVSNVTMDFIQRILSGDPI